MSANGGDGRLKITALALKAARVSALKAEDGLFFIANGKYCARPCFATRQTGIVKKRIGQCGDDPPLRRAGILRLIDQNMVETIIDFEQYPLRRAMAAQHAVGHRHQIVIIEHAAAVFLRRIAAQ